MSEPTVPSSTTPAHRRPVTLIPGDGIGPEVIAAARSVVDAAGAPIDWEPCEAGHAVFARGIATGLTPETIESIRRTRVVLKGPLATPIGEGEKSANVTIRKLFELYANVRPVRELPGVPTPFAGRNLDLVVVRENVEDLYAGVEHMQTPGVAQCLKLISAKGSEKIIRLAFELARAEGRRHVHLATKANIMKLTEGMLKRVFERIAPEYPDIEARHIIIDNCAHQLVRRPEQFDVIVTSNMFGDIISDLTSGLVGGLGFAPSSNVGSGLAMFEAVHGTAPDIAGKNVANPTAAMLSSVLMLRHLELFELAATIEHALLVTLEEGRCRTADMPSPDGRSGSSASTTQFAQAVIANLGRRSKHVTDRRFKPLRMPPIHPEPDFVKASTRMVVGVDVFVESGLGPVELGQAIEKIVDGSSLTLKTIANRGVQVYPSTGNQTDCVDHYGCRFVPRSVGAEVAEDQIIDLLRRLGATHRWMHIEKLHEFDGKPAFSKAQGER